MHRVRRVIDRNHGTWRGWVRHQLAMAELAVGRLDEWTHIAHPLQVERLVFVCLGNINRSAFADEVARHQGLARCSIGLSTTTGASAFATAIKTARVMGLDLSAHRATDLRDYSHRDGDLLLAMEVRHVHRLIRSGIPRERIALLGAWASPCRVHLHDPHVLSEAYFHTCFTLIRSAVTNLHAELQAAGSPCARP